jgi:tRNA-specific 2-thiouridylase
MVDKAKKPKVFVGMSGGVDSSVSAALLKKAGYDVTGVFIKVWSPDWLPCTWKEERRDAMRVAAHLNIPFLTFDFEDDYKRSVVDYMLAEYKKGNTPNPDVMCNKEIKFGSFLKKARELGADYIATGHYAQTDDKHRLLAGNDKNKDQSYFLWTLTDSQLKHVLFPVGHLEKSEVRALAAKFRLPVATKKDSQGLCFIGKVEMKDFLSHYISAKKGNVLDESGHVIGEHNGAVFYTIGERHGFRIFKHSSHDEPYYIVAKDSKANTVTVSHHEHTSQNERRDIPLTQINWVYREPQPHATYMARFRYRQIMHACQIQNGKVIFTEPQRDISPGQSVVVYEKEECIGGGIIA